MENGLTLRMSPLLCTEYHLKHLSALLALRLSKSATLLAAICFRGLQLPSLLVILFYNSFDLHVVL